MLTRRTLLFCLSLPALTAWAGVPTHAETGDLAPQASNFVNTMGKEATAVMADKSLSPSERLERFRDLFHRGFDIPTIARFVLGRYWNVATPAQQQDYLVQFEEMVVRSYAAHFDTYGSSAFRIVSSRPESDHDAFVTTSVAPLQGPPVTVEWRVRRRDARLAIIDVVAEGVSMSVSERQEFASVIQAKGGNIDAFIQALRDKNAALTSGTP
jgi:phospholipid transport system substrate-binding protein